MTWPTVQPPATWPASERQWPGGSRIGILTQNNDLGRHLSHDTIFFIYIPRCVNFLAIHKQIVRLCMFWLEAHGWDTDSEFITEQINDLNQYQYREKNTSAHGKSQNMRKHWGWIFRNVSGVKLIICAASVEGFKTKRPFGIFRSAVLIAATCTDYVDVWLKKLVSGINGTVWKPTMFWFLWKSYFCTPCSNLSTHKNTLDHLDLHQSSQQISMFVGMLACTDGA